MSGNHRLYETSTMDSPIESADEGDSTTLPEEDEALNKQTAEIAIGTPNEKNLQQQDASLLSNHDENDDEGSSFLNDTATPGGTVSSSVGRPRSPSAYSEMSRPDPPSIIDHRVLDDLNDDDWEEEGEESEAIMAPNTTTNTTTTRRGPLEQHSNIEASIIQRALSQGSAEKGDEYTSTPGDEQKVVAASTVIDLAHHNKDGQDTFLDTLADKTVTTTSQQQQQQKQQQHPPEKSPQDTLVEQLDRLSNHAPPQEPPAVLKHSTSATNLPLTVDSSTAPPQIETQGVTDTMENDPSSALGIDEQPHHHQQQKEPPARSPGQAYQVDTKFSEHSEKQQSENTPVVSNGKFFERQISGNNAPLSNQSPPLRNNNPESSPMENWSDAAQNISPQPELPSWGSYSPTFVNADQWNAASPSPRRASAMPEATTLHDTCSSQRRVSPVSSAPAGSVPNHTPIRDHQLMNLPQASHEEQVAEFPPPPPLAPAFVQPTRQQQMSSSGRYASVPASSNSSSPPFMVMNNDSLNGQTAAPSSSGRCKIHLHMQEEVQTSSSKKSSFLGHIRTRSSRMIGLHSISEQPEFVSTDRGLLSVSWFPGTSAIELQEHVRKSVIRKLQLPVKAHLVDLRVLDETEDPPEEIVLSPHIPNGSTFTLRFSVNNDGASTPGSIIRPPDSPSAAPAHQLAGLSNKQMADLTQQLDELRAPGKEENGSSNKRRKNTLRLRKSEYISQEEEPSGKDHGGNGETSEEDSKKSDEDEMDLHDEDPIEARLREITNLLLDDRQRKRGVRQEKRQVIFVLLNYFILFLGLIALSAELQARAPEWLASMEKQMKDVRDCSADQEALFECVSRGDFAGLVASVILWLSRSVIPRRIFLFGFESPKKLWTVVYESLVTAICWGVSYMFIRRGMNPDTRERFLQKYWKDAVYGSLAGFNAAFMKQVLKNLIPQEAVEDVLRDRQLRFLSWLPSFE